MTDFPFPVDRPRAGDLSGVTKIRLETGVNPGIRSSKFNVSIADLQGVFDKNEDNAKVMADLSNELEKRTTKSAIRLRLMVQAVADRNAGSKHSVVDSKPDLFSRQGDAGTPDPQPSKSNPTNGSVAATRRHARPDRHWRFRGCSGAAECRFWSIALSGTDVRHLEPDRLRWPDGACLGSA